MDYMFANYVNGSLRLHTFRHYPALTTTWNDIRSHIENNDTEVELTASVEVGSDEYDEITSLIGNNYL